MQDWNVFGSRSATIDNFDPRGLARIVGEGGCSMCFSTRNVLDTCPSLKYKWPSYFHNLYLHPRVSTSQLAVLLLSTNWKILQPSDANRRERSPNDFPSNEKSNESPSVRSSSWSVSYKSNKVAKLLAGPLDQFPISRIKLHGYLEVRVAQFPIN